MGTEAQRCGKQQGTLLERVRSHLLQGEVSTHPGGELDTQSYLMDGHGLLWHALAGKVKPALAIHYALISDLVSLVHAVHGNPDEAPILAPQRERFHWPTMTRSIQEYIQSCGSRRRNRSTSQRIALLSDHATRP